jgi:hypothetical protein
LCSHVPFEKKLPLLLCVAAAWGLGLPANGATPLYVHVSMFNDPTTNEPRVVVGWLTMSNASSVVRYGIAKHILLSEQANMDAPERYDSEAGFNHFVALPPLRSASIFYQVGDGTNWSPVLMFRNPNAVKTQFRAWVCGDLGIDNAEGTLKAINMRASEIDLYLHPGDLAYANDHPWQYETWWQRWFRLVQNATSQAPYMASVGNHEVSCRCVELGDTTKFTVFKKKFLYPGSAVTNGERGSGDNMWYSFDLGPVHVLSFSTESDYVGAPIDLKRSARAQTQVQWMAADLAAVNRSVTPFVIVMGHRPIYVDSPGCLDNAGNPIGQPAKIQAVFEEMFHANQVDVFIAGHTHMYQRTLPMYNNSIDVARGMVQIVAGGGGSLEGLSKFHATPNLPFMVSRWNATTTYGILDANETHLVWNCYSTEGDLVDNLVIKSKF